MALGLGRRQTRHNSFFRLGRVHGVRTLTRMALYCLHTGSISDIYRHYTGSTSTLHRLYIDSTSALHRLYIDSTSTLHRLYIDSTSTLSISALCTCPSSTAQLLVFVQGGSEQEYAEFELCSHADNEIHISHSAELGVKTVRDAHGRPSHSGVEVPCRLLHRPLRCLLCWLCAIGARP